MNLIGFVIRIYHDARSSERQIQVHCWVDKLLHSELARLLSYERRNAIRTLLAGFFMYPVFMPGADKALVTSIGVLPSAFAMLCYILDAQLFLQPQPVSHVEDTLSYENPFFGFITYFKKTLVPLKLYRSHDIQRVTLTHSLTHSLTHTSVCKRWISRELMVEGTE